MGIVSAVVVYICIWWVVIFCVLPIGLSTQYEEQDQAMAPGSPAKLDIKKKFLITTIVSFFVWVVVCSLIMLDIFSFREWAGAAF